MLRKQIARTIVAAALLSLPLWAQQQQQQPPQQQQPAPQQEPATHVTLQGQVRTADGTPIPGASLKIVEAATGKSWLTWTDEQGKFRLPELPSGKYHIEATQIGFVVDQKDVEVVTEPSPDIILSLRVQTLPEIAAAAQAQPAPAGGTPPPQKAPTTAPTNPPGAGQGTPPPQKGTATPPMQAARGGRQGQPGQGGRGGQGGFSEATLGGLGGADTTGMGDQTGGADQTGLGAGASADAMLMSGATATGDTSGINMLMAMGMGGQNAGQGIPGVQGLSQPGQGQQGFGDQNAMILMGGGGPGGRGGGGPGGGGGGRGGGPGGGGRGGGRGPQGQGQNGVPWGLQQVIRRRINQMHYSLNETLNDSAFDARPWLASGNPVAKVPFDSNNFGGSLGGPFRIPKLYDGRDKTYFFLNANFLHGSQGLSNLSLVPTLDERSGNFCTAGITLYDYTSNFAGQRTPLPGTGTGNCNLQGAINPVTSQPYLNTASQGLLAYIPQPNYTSQNGLDNFLFQTTTPTNNQRINMRVNQTINAKWNFGVTYNIAQVQTSGFGAFPSETNSASSRGQGVVTTLNYIHSPRLINTLALSFSRNRSQSLNGYAYNQDIESTLGITGVSTAPIDWGLPSLNFSGTLTGLNDTVPAIRRNENWFLTDTIMYTLPKHTFHFGVGYRRYQFNNINDPTPRGSFTFTGGLTENWEINSQGNPQPVPISGNTAAAAAYSFADYLLGLPQSTLVRFGASQTYLRSWGMLGYFTDDWHMFPSFTLTYGLRYEIMLPPYELYNHISNLDLNSTFTQAFAVTPGEVGPFSGALPRSLIRADYNDWQPSIGIAWRLPGKMLSGKHAITLRAGYRIFDQSQIYNNLGNSSLLNQYPWATTLSIASSSTQVLTLQNGFPAQAANTATNTLAIDPNYKNLYVQIWNFSLEGQIVEGLVWQLTYTGTKGTDLDLLSAPNVLSVTNTGTGTTIPGTLGFTYDSSGASSIYHGMQARLARRMHNGLTYTVLYTFSKSIDNSSTIGGSPSVVVQEFPLFSLQRGLSSFDERHVITGNSTYELPFGERKRWAKKGAEARIFGNYRLSGSVSWHTGMPFTALVQGAISDFSGSGGTFSTRADAVPGCNPNAGSHTLGEWFNTACFVIPGSAIPGTSPVAFYPGTYFGNAGRDTIIGPSFFDVNMALARSMQLNRDGTRRLDLRWEVTNISNHANYSSFGSTYSPSGNPINLGRITGAGGMRTMDAVIRLNF